VAGLVEGASKGEGRGNQFLDNVRACHALVHVVRAFEDPSVAHVTGAVDPIEDIRTVNLELILADLETAERAIARLEKPARREADAGAALATIERIRNTLNEEKPVTALELSAEEEARIRDYRFLTAKSVLYAVNISEDDLPGPESDPVRAVAGFARGEGNAVVPICAKLEEEIARLDPEEAKLFLTDIGLEEPGLQRLVKATRELLGLISYFTFNEEQARAWAVPVGTTAPRAAGIIHTDFEKHFVRAEVTSFADFDACGGRKGAHEKGRLRTEGHDYLVQDADVIYFRIGI
jgi:GTP-binding protein YchF